MVDKEVIQHKISIIEDNLLKLKKLTELPEEEFLDKFYYIESSKHLLQVSIEVMLDVANHIIARERYKAPKTYAEAFVILVDQGILPKEKETTFIKMAKFRNRIVHLYKEVDDREVYAIMKESLADSQAFVRAIVNKVL